MIYDKSENKKLNHSDITHMGQEQNSFLDALHIHSIPERISTDLGTAIAMEQISTAIDKMKVGKAQIDC